ncbi:hypothetical protein HMPREF9016_01801 [Neisseria sp. oral taxon 014 str. F0314]|nr:hypothetical protein HMPREF9016_01801 [Neisseria sp. oral taxon 014 str. F0314]
MPSPHFGTVKRNPNERPSEKSFQTASCFVRGFRRSFTQTNRGRFRLNDGRRQGNQQFYHKKRTLLQGAF